MSDLSKPTKSKQLTRKDLQGILPPDAEMPSAESNGVNNTNLRYQRSSIHEVLPAKPSGVNPFFKLPDSLNTQSIDGSFQNGSIINQQLSQSVNTAKKEDQQHIIINNNINITTIHNVTGTAPSGHYAEKTNSMGTNSGVPNYFTMQKSYSAQFGNKPKTNSNLNLLLQNPLSQIQAPNTD